MPKVKTIRKGRYGFNAEHLAGITVSAAVKEFKKVPEHIVKECHAEALSAKKAEGKQAEPEAEGSK